MCLVIKHDWERVKNHWLCRHHFCSGCISCYYLCIVRIEVMTSKSEYIWVILHEIIRWWLHAILKQVIFLCMMYLDASKFKKILIWRAVTFSGHIFSSIWRLTFCLLANYRNCNFQNIKHRKICKNCIVHLKNWTSYQPTLSFKLRDTEIKTEQI